MSSPALGGKGSPGEGRREARGKASAGSETSSGLADHNEFGRKGGSVYSRQNEEHERAQCLDKSPETVSPWSAGAGTGVRDRRGGDELAQTLPS